MSDLYRPSDLVIFARVLLDVLKFAGVFMLKVCLLVADRFALAVLGERVRGRGCGACASVRGGHWAYAHRRGVRRRGALGRGLRCVARDGLLAQVRPRAASRPPHACRWGGHHVTHSLLRMLRLQRPPSASPKSPFGEHYFPYAAADLHTAQDYVAFHTIKEMHCHLQTVRIDTVMPS